MTTETKETLVLDGKKLHAIFNATPSAEVLGEALNQRERNRSNIDINRMNMTLRREGAKIVDEDALRFWEALEDAGIGVIVYGRNKKKPRFEMHYGLISVAKAGVDGTNEEAKLLHPRTVKDRKPRAKKEPTTVKKPTYIKQEKQDNPEQTYVIPVGDQVMKLNKTELEILSNIINKLDR